MNPLHSITDAIAARDEAIAERDRARRWAMHYEAEHNRLAEQVRAVANDCLGEWGSEHIGNALLAILKPHDDEEEDK